MFKAGEAMIVLQTTNISKAYGIDNILSDVSIQIQSRDRIGLVGINGAGKSTLLKIISGKILPDSGSVSIAKGSKIGYLAQDNALESKNTIWIEMNKVFSYLIEQENYIRTLEAKMSEDSILNNSNQYDKLMDEYSKTVDDFREKGGYLYQAKIRGVLHGLGFQDYDYHNQYIDILSGGQKTRLALAKLLLEEPDLLILDEPTNYLDIDTLTWLEGYLKSYSGAILIVSHDRYFLDAVVTTIYEINNTKVKKYIGNYSQYIEQKAEQLEQELINYEKQQAEINKLEEFINKNIARASTTNRAQSRRKTLDKLERLGKPATNQKSASFSFNTDIQSGKNVLNVTNLAMRFSDKLLFENVSFDIKRDERVALIGPNGIGKSTLLKLIIGEELLTTNGTIKFGTNIIIGYYAQEQNDLNFNKKVIDELWDEYPDLTEKEIRTLLGNFLFSADDVFKYIKDLSGGEKARISLAKLILKKPNFLILDEPTNHLDIFSREALENSLLDYTGTILFISHDRYFLNQISTRTLELTPNGVTNYLGNYDYYLEKKAELAELQTKVNTNNVEKDNKNQYQEEKQKVKLERQLKRKIEALELEIELLEDMINQLEIEIASPTVFNDYQLSLSKNAELSQAKEKVEKLLEEWQITQEELED